MCPLTDPERQQLESRRREFPAFYAELMPVLVDSVGRVGVEPAHTVLTNAVDVAPLVDEVLRGVPVGGGDDRVWLITRIGYLVGEYLVQKYDGCWFVNDHVETRTFARYVVGQFAVLPASTARLDPFQIAAEYVDTPPERSLLTLIEEVEGELARTVRAA